MSNRIREVALSQHRWDAAEAEIWITVQPEQPGAGLELRGRLVGPRCPGVRTIEVAYPLRPLPAAAAPAGLAARVVIPEPVAWQPDHPCCYEGTVELWQHGQKCDQAPLRVVGRAAPT
jgi:hypothetical protein